MKRALCFLFIFATLFSASPTLAWDVTGATKNVARYVTFPIYKNDGTLLSGATGLDTECDFYAAGSAPDGFADVTNEAAEIGSTGWYYIQFTQGEMNNDLAACQVKSSSTGAVATPLNISTLPLQANIVSADTDSLEPGDFKADGTAQAGTNNTVQLAAAENYADNQIRDACIGIMSGTGKGQWRVVTGYVGSTDTATVYPNWLVNPSTDSKYSVGGCAWVAGVVGDVNGNLVGSADSVTDAVTCGTVSDKTGYSLTQAFPSNFNLLYIDANGKVVSDSVTDSVTCGTVSDKTGYSLTQTFPANFSALDISAGGVVTADASCPSAADIWTNATRSLTDKADFSLAASQTFNLTGDITGSLSGTVGSCTALGSDAVDAADITLAAGNKLADIFARRNTANIEASSFGDTLNFKSLYGAVAQQTHRTRIFGGQWICYKADDETELNSRDVTTDSSAAPITGVGSAP